MLATLSASLRCLLCRLWHHWRNATALNPLHKLLTSSPELEEHAALLLPLCDHLEGVQAAVAPVAVPAAECDEGAVEAVVPGSILVHVPQAVLICTDYKTQWCRMIVRAKKYCILLSKITYYLYFFKAKKLRFKDSLRCWLYSVKRQHSFWTGWTILRQNSSISYKIRLVEQFLCSDTKW